MLQFLYSPMKLIIFLVLAIAFAQPVQIPKKSAIQSKKDWPKKIETKDDYDPDKLGPGEVGCGRPSSVKSPPCKCMEHRVKKAAEERLKCSLIASKEERQKCLNDSDACNVTVIDAEHAGWSGEESSEMPAQCKRTCRKARCECCQT